MITEIAGVPLAVFLNALPGGRQIVCRPQPVKLYRLFVPNPLYGGVFVGGVIVQLVPRSRRAFHRSFPPTLTLRAASIASRMRLYQMDSPFLSAK